MFAKPYYTRRADFKKRGSVEAIDPFKEFYTVPQYM